MVKSWRARLKVEHFLTQNAWSKSCELKVALLAFSSRLQWIQSGFWGLVKKIGQKVQLLLLTSNFFLTRRYKVCYQDLVTEEKLI